MASKKELKEIIVDLKMELVKANIPKGHCPYFYYSTSKHISSSEFDCYSADWDCSECTEQFYKDKKEDIEKYVNNL